MAPNFSTRVGSPNQELATTEPCLREHNEIVDIATIIHNSNEGSSRACKVLFIFPSMSTYVVVEIPSEAIRQIRDYLRNPSETTRQEYSRAMKSINNVGVSTMLSRPVLSQSSCKICTSSQASGISGPVDVWDLSSLSMPAFCKRNCALHCSNTNCRYLSEKMSLQSTVEAEGVSFCACCETRMFNNDGWECKGCRVALYCSKLCQAKSWWNHRWFCKRSKNTNDRVD